MIDGIFDSISKYTTADESEEVNLKSKDKAHYMAGFLFKKSNGVVQQSWRMRYFLFSKDLKTLTYYYADDNISVRRRRGQVFLDNVEVQPVPAVHAEGREFAFEITCFKATNSLKKGEVRTLLLAASREEERLHWIQVFNECVKASIEALILKKELVVKSGYVSLMKHGMGTYERKFISFSSDGDFTIYETERDFNHNHFPSHQIAVKELRDNPTRSYGVLVKDTNLSLDFGTIHLDLVCDTQELAQEWASCIQVYVLHK